MRSHPSYSRRGVRSPKLRPSKFKLRHYPNVHQVKTWIFCYKTSLPNSPPRDKTAPGIKQVEQSKLLGPHGHEGLKRLAPNDYTRCQFSGDNISKPMARCRAEGILCYRLAAHVTPRTSVVPT